MIEKKVPFLAVLSSWACLRLSLDVAKKKNFDFLANTSQDGMEFNGFNTKMCRESNGKVKQKTKAVYLPLIDMHPAEYDTVLTKMVKVRELTRKNGQKFSVVTFDQQLYNLAIQIQWDMIKDFLAQ